MKFAGTSNFNDDVIRVIESPAFLHKSFMWGGSGL
jgi:hypothetical protein